MTMRPPRASSAAKAIALRTLWPGPVDHRRASDIERPRRVPVRERDRNSGCREPPESERTRDPGCHLHETELTGVRLSLDRVAR